MTKKLSTKEDITAHLKELEMNRRLSKAEIPPTTYPTEISSYQTVRVRAAERVRDLELEYRWYIEEHIGAIILQGDEAKAKEFAKVAEEVGSTLTFNTNDVYRKMTQRAFFMMGGTGNFTVDQIADLFAELRHLTRSELGMFRVKEPHLGPTAGRAFTKPDDLADAFREGVRLSNGIEVTKKAIFKFVGDESLKEPNPRVIIPVVLIGVKETEMDAFNSLFPGRNIVVNVDEITDMQQAVMDAFTNLKTTIKNHTK